MDAVVNDGGQRARSRVARSVPTPNGAKKEEHEDQEDHDGVGKGPPEAQWSSSAPCTADDAVGAARGAWLAAERAFPLSPKWTCSCLRGRNRPPPIWLKLRTGAPEGVHLRPPKRHRPTPRKGVRARDREVVAPARILVTTSRTFSPRSDFARQGQPKVGLSPDSKKGGRNFSHSPEHPLKGSGRDFQLLPRWGN